MMPPSLITLRGKFENLGVFPLYSSKLWESFSRRCLEITLLPLDGSPPPIGFIKPPFFILSGFFPLPDAVASLPLSLDWILFFFFCAAQLRGEMNAVSFLFSPLPPPFFFVLFSPPPNTRQGNYFFFPFSCTRYEKESKFPSRCVKQRRPPFFYANDRFVNKPFFFSHPPPPFRASVSSGFVPFFSLPSARRMPLPPFFPFPNEECVRSLFPFFMRALLFLLRTQKGSPSIPLLPLPFLKLPSMIGVF